MSDEPAILPRGTFYGITSSVEIAGATLSDVYHAQARRLPLHGHEAAYFCMLVEGEYREQSGPSDVTYRPCTIAFHSVGMLHVDSIGEAGARFFIIELNAAWATLAQSFMSAAVPVAELRGGDVVWTATRLYLDLREGTLTDLSVESALYELIGALPAMEPVDHESERAASAALGAIVATIDADLATSLSLASLAQQAGFHPVHLARVFRHAYHRSIGEHIQGRRIQAATRLMLESKLSLSRIAAECGFFDQSHFNRAFKSVTGTTPSLYRKRIAG